LAALPGFSLGPNQASEEGAQFLSRVFHLDWTRRGQPKGARAFGDKGLEGFEALKFLFLACQSSLESNPLCAYELPILLPEELLNRCFPTSELCLKEAHFLTEERNAHIDRL
jgi:hypothetical protein